MDSSNPNTQDAVDWGRAHKDFAEKVVPVEVVADDAPDNNVLDDDDDPVDVVADDASDDNVLDEVDDPVDVTEPFYETIKAQLATLAHYRCRPPQPCIDGQTALQFLLEETKCNKYHDLFETVHPTARPDGDDGDGGGHPVDRKYFLESVIGITETELATALGGEDKIKGYLDEHYKGKSWHYTGSEWEAEEKNKYATIEGVVGLTNQELIDIGIDDVADRRRLVRASETISNWPMHLQMTRVHKTFTPDNVDNNVVFHIARYNEWVNTYYETKANRLSDSAIATVSTCRDLELRRCDLLMEVCMEMLRGLVQAVVTRVLDGGDRVDFNTMETVVRIMSMCESAFLDDGTFLPAEVHLLHIAKLPKPTFDVPGFTLSREFGKGLEPAPPDSARLENVADNFKCGDLVEVMKGGGEIGAVVIERDRDREKERARERKTDLDYLMSYRNHLSGADLPFHAREHARARREADVKEPIVWKRDYTTRHGPMLHDDLHDDDEPAGGTVCVKFTDVTEGHTECVPAAAVYHREEMIRRRVAEKAERCWYAWTMFLSAFFDDCESSFITLCVQTIVVTSAITEMCNSTADTLSKRHVVDDILDKATVDNAATRVSVHEKSHALYETLMKLDHSADTVLRHTVNWDLLIRDHRSSITLCKAALATRNAVSALFTAIRDYKDATVKDDDSFQTLNRAINEIQVTKVMKATATQKQEADLITNEAKAGGRDASVDADADDGTLSPADEGIITNV